MDEIFSISPIGFFHCMENFTYDVPRQGVLAGSNRGVIRLNNGFNFEQATYRLDSFSHIWVLFIFHQNNSWKPMTTPPRHTKQKVGVFASRAPYRPNRIGMSCVRLISVNKLEITVEAHDLLDGTPIVDIKPYLPYSDSFPEASPGWTQGADELFSVEFSDAADKQLIWLEANGVPCIRQFVLDSLSANPLDGVRHRLYDISSGAATLAYRTWRVRFSCYGGNVIVENIFSAYLPQELAPDAPDKYGDKDIHRKFSSLFI